MLVLISSKERINIEDFFTAINGYESKIVVKGFFCSHSLSNPSYITSNENHKSNLRIIFKQYKYHLSLEVKEVNIELMDKLLSINFHIYYYN